MCLQFQGEQPGTRGHMRGWRQNQAWINLLQTQKVGAVALSRLSASSNMCMHHHQATTELNTTF